jgi:hypothetical protein
VRRSLFAFAGALLLAVVAAAVVLVVELFFAAIAGNESFTPEVVRGMPVIAGMAGAAVVVYAIVRWPAAARSAVGLVLAAAALAVLVAGGFVFVKAMGKPPVNLGPPEIRGVAQVGHVLHANPGRWDARRKEPLDFVYEWRACRGDDCLYYEEEDLGGRPREYLVDKSDVGRRIVVTVTAYGNLWTDPVDSRPTAVVKP